MKTRFLFLAAALSSAFSFGQTYLNDYFNGPNLNSANAWVVQTPVNNGYEWGWTSFSGNGYALISNFNAGTNYLTESWLVSPAVTLTGASNPILSFTNTKRFAGADIELHISTSYTGDVATTTWTNITAQAGFDTDIASWAMMQSNPIDLSAYNDQTVHFAFRYTGSASNGSTYQIDNIRIEEDLCVGAIFCEKFNGVGLIGNNAWTVYETDEPGGNTYTWYHNTFDGASNARVSNYIAATSTNIQLETYLITPAIDLSAEATAFLSFDNAKRFAGPDLAVLISTDYDGSSNPSTTGTWTDITSFLNMDSDIDTWYFENSGDFDLADYIGEATVYIAFKYNGITTNGSTYQLDNVLVSPDPLTPVVPIYDIQYTTNMDGNSPWMDQTVTTTGIVTGTYASGYYIQDGDGAWNGIDVFNSANTPQVGDELKITGTVVEFNGITQISYVNAYQVLSTGNVLPTPTVLTTAQASVEAYESVLIKVENVICTAGVNGFGEWIVADMSGPITVDDKMFYYAPTQGNTYDVTGIAAFGFSVYRIYPRNLQDISEILGLSESQLAQINIYPNPATDVMTVNGAVGAEMRITDSQGKEVMNVTLSSESEVVSISHLENGIYFTQFLGEHSQRTYKIVKQ